jgi:hypothetical protein
MNRTAHASLPSTSRVDRESAELHHSRFESYLGTPQERCHAALNWVFLNLWATDREQTEGVERAAVQFRHDHTSGASEF